jgi:hypothetical protein
MNAAAFDAMMQKGLDDAKANRSRPIDAVIADIRQGM